MCCLHLQAREIIEHDHRVYYRIHVKLAVSKSGNPGPGPVPKTRAQIRIFFITSLLRQ
jgi:hypothetical protein